ncbi:MAG TPA: putative Ig domain-containing protein, partial [bacterium]|nr:putative Ig domain-containing protein [bacterium]
AGTYRVTFRATDVAGGFAVKTAVITIKNVNRNPVLGAINNQTADENKFMSFTVSASDPDKEDQIRLNVTASDLPKGATYAAGKFSWMPGYDQAGDYTVKFTAKDPNGGEDVKSVSIKVNNTNRAPKMNAVGTKNGKEGSEISFSASASDPDNDNLSFSLVGGPSGATMSSDGKFTWTPQTGQSGTFNFTVKVSDGTAEASAPVTVIVAKAPQPQGGGQ